MTANPGFEVLHREVTEAIRSESLFAAGFGAALA
jgi:hypothetical protein